MPKISVIIPTYNRAQFIEDSIKSVLEQDYEDYEIIVVDDGSTDNTEDVIKPYLHRLQYIRYFPRKGPSYARNLGIKHARGK